MVHKKFVYVLENQEQMQTFYEPFQQPYDTDGPGKYC